MPPEWLDVELILSVVYRTMQTKEDSGSKQAASNLQSDVQGAYVELLGLSLLETPSKARLEENWELMAQHCLSDGKLCVDALVLLRAISARSRDGIDQFVAHEPLRDFSVFIQQQALSGEDSTHYKDWKRLSLLARTGAMCQDLFLRNHEDTFDLIMQFLMRDSNATVDFETVGAVLGIANHYVRADIKYRPQILELINARAEPMMRGEKHSKLCR